MLWGGVGRPKNGTDMPAHSDHAVVTLLESPKWHSYSKIWVGRVTQSYNAAWHWSELPKYFGYSPLSPLPLHGG